MRESESRLASKDRKAALNRTQTLLSSYSHIPVPVHLVYKQSFDAKPAQKLPFFVMKNISYRSAVRAKGFPTPLGTYNTFSGVNRPLKLSIQQ